MQNTLFRVKISGRCASFLKRRSLIKQLLGLILIFARLDLANCALCLSPVIVDNFLSPLLESIIVAENDLIYNSTSFLFDDPSDYPDICESSVNGPFCSGLDAFSNTHQNTLQMSNRFESFMTANLPPSQRHSYFLPLSGTLSLVTAHNALADKNVKREKYLESPKNASHMATKKNISVNFLNPTETNLFNGLFGRCSARGAWFLNSKGKLAVRSSSALRFDTRAVIQNIEIKGFAWVYGKLRGVEQWRRVFDSSQEKYENEENNVVNIRNQCSIGSIVTTMWKGDFREYTSKVHFSTRESVCVNWMDGDSTFRNIGWEESQCLFAGEVWMMKEIDEIVVIPGHEGAVINLLKIGTVMPDFSGEDEAQNQQRPIARILRNGLVVSDKVSYAAEMRSLKDVLTSKINNNQHIFMRAQKGSFDSKIETFKKLSSEKSTPMRQLQRTNIGRSALKLYKFAKALQSNFGQKINDESMSHISIAVKKLRQRLKQTLQSDVKKIIFFDDWLIKHWDLLHLESASSDSIKPFDELTAQYHYWHEYGPEAEEILISKESELRVKGVYHCTYEEPTPLELTFKRGKQKAVSGVFRFVLRDKHHDVPLFGVVHDPSGSVFLEPRKSNLPRHLVAVPLSVTRLNATYFEGYIEALGCDGVELTQINSTSSPYKSRMQNDETIDAASAIIEETLQILKLRKDWRKIMLKLKADGISMIPSSDAKPMSITF